jgi:hypothetical protein
MGFFTGVGEFFIKCMKTSMETAAESAREMKLIMATLKYYSMP